jgi:hypothetical protein
MFSVTGEQEGWRTPTPSLLEMEAADDWEDWRMSAQAWFEREAPNMAQEGWRSADPMCLGMKAALLEAFESCVTTEFANDEEELLGTWSEVEGSEWGEEEVLMEEEQPELGLLQEMQLPRGEQLVNKVPLEEQLRTELFRGEPARGEAAPRGAAQEEAASGGAVRGAAAPGKAV